MEDCGVIYRTTLVQNRAADYISTQTRKPSEVLSFVQCNLKLPFITELLIHPSSEQMEELQNVTEFGDKNLIKTP